MIIPYIKFKLSANTKNEINTWSVFIMLYPRVTWTTKCSWQFYTSDILS